jgi:Peptidase A4 family
MTAGDPSPTFPAIGRRKYIGILVAAAIMAFALLPVGASAAAHHHNAPKHKVGRGTSTNWSGYAANGTGATQVIGTWTQPTATCGSRENSWSSPWVGIDGNNSNTVEQIGTDTDCSGGTPVYYAWYEMYPKSLVVISSITVSPGDSFTGQVTYLGNGSYKLQLTNNTTHAPTFSTTQFSKKARRTSVEWVMEGPSSGLLTNFGTVGFSGGSATISGNTGNLNALGAQSITMVTSQGDTRALPGSLTAGGSAFSVDWLHS